MRRCNMSQKISTSFVSNELSCAAPLAAPADSVENDSCISDFTDLSLEKLEKFTISDTSRELGNKYRAHFVFFLGHSAGCT